MTRACTVHSVVQEMVPKKETEALLWVNEQPDKYGESGAASQARGGYRPRRSHTKSRNGCQKCKQRRIKCDEAKPSCGQCQDRRIQCDLAEPKSLEELKKASPVAKISTRKMIESYMKDMPIPCPEIKDPAYKKSHAMELLDHFFETKDLQWIGSIEFQIIMLKYGLDFCLDAPYLVHGILAFSANHLAYLYPDEKKYSTAATLHYEHSLISYASKLRTPLLAETGDAVVGCCHLHTMMAFRHVTSGQYSGGFTWLRAMQGVRILWETDTLAPHKPDSCWFPVCIESRAIEEVECHHENDKPDSWEAKTSQALHQLCEMPPEQENPYTTPLAHLCRLMHLESIGHNNVGMFMVFIGKLPASFLQLLDQNDPRAFLLVAYWATFISLIDQWWVIDSARIECLRLCAHLDTVPDATIRDLMKFPASRCGYVMRDSTQEADLVPIKLIPVDGVTPDTVDTTDSVVMPSISQLLI